MAKTILFSFDDGSIYDGRLVELLNRYGFRGTFHLNSGLEDFVWYYEDRFPVRRQVLSGTVEQYRGHEIASHSLHHHRLDALTPPQLRREVEEDCQTLKTIFGVTELGFGVPFTACGEREIRILRKLVSYIRLSEFARDFSLPKDPYHIPIHALCNDGDVYEKLARFAAWEGEGLFVLAGHSYELEVLNHWEYMEDLLGYIQGLGFENGTTMDFVKQNYRR